MKKEDQVKQDLILD